MMVVEIEGATLQRTKIGTLCSPDLFYTLGRSRGSLQSPHNFLKTQGQTVVEAVDCVRVL